MTRDIHERIESDFNSRSAEVVKLLSDASLKTDFLHPDRIIRCLLFLAEKDIDKLKRYIESASQDPRDVVMWAEYADGGQGDILNRLRDFNNPFESADIVEED